MACYEKIRRYDISFAEYQALLESQGEACWICGGTNPNGGLLFIDHDHETGEVRGLLCATCNQGLGMFKDAPSLLIRAAEYLSR
jgi:hypothetical protein